MGQRKTGILTQTFFFKASLGNGADAASDRSHKRRSVVHSASSRASLDEYEHLGANHTRTHDGRQRGLHTHWKNSLLMKKAAMTVDN